MKNMLWLKKYAKEFLWIYKSIVELRTVLSSVDPIPLNATITGQLLKPKSHKVH